MKKMNLHNKLLIIHIGLDLLNDDKGCTLERRAFFKASLEMELMVIYRMTMRDKKTRGNDTSWHFRETILKQILSANSFLWLS
mmetsp:Transcript_23942/g.29120  ORF Transcript_23942/g.29120 Transcript_23942/m.29120 type:complete len:83 (+) Transcript_23942:474-722(+)